MFGFIFVISLVCYAFSAHLTYRVFERYDPGIKTGSDTDKKFIAYCSVFWPFTGSVLFFYWIMFHAPRRFWEFVIPDIRVEPAQVPENNQYHCRCCPQRAHDPGDLSQSNVFRANR
jgi:hypothetical protein